MKDLYKTVLYDTHVKSGANMVEFGGWQMPVNYPEGIINEHMATRRAAGLFDVSHMGRLIFRGSDALPFLQHTLTNNAAALDTGESQYTLIQNEAGGAIDDAYLYRFKDDEYLLVVNASNREKDVAHFKNHIDAFNDIEMTDQTFDIAMISLQGPKSRKIIKEVLTSGTLPEPARNYLSIVMIGDVEILVARTGYTGEPLGFELFMDNKHAAAVWEFLTKKGALPVGLGARDTLRLEASLPLYGHELGMDAGECEIPVFASKLSKFAVSFSPLKGNFIGKIALLKQFETLKKITHQDFTDINALPKTIMALAIMDKGIARQGYEVFYKGSPAGFITSGTMIPFQEPKGEGLDAQFEDTPKRRAIALGLIDSNIPEGAILEVAIRKKRCKALVVPYHMRSEAPPFVRSIPYNQLNMETRAPKEADYPRIAGNLIVKALDNHAWRQKQCINLIPSEMSQSYISRLLSISDPVNRYAEHKQVKALFGEDVFYYQGTQFIQEIETRLNEEFQKFFRCTNVESRVISGQMANTAFFSALVDYLNRADRKNEPQRISKIINNHIIKGGHLSAQPMGALRDFVARDPSREKPAVVNFPVEKGNPYKIDIQACRELIKDHQPELIILGKSMIIHKEPVAEIRDIVDEYAPSCLIMYDMAHVLGLYGPHFQEPLKQGADIITGSTHKTFFGTQRGVIAGNFDESSPEFELWETIQRRTFPGSVSNHHLGTMTGLLFAAYEMNHFKNAYQKAIISNAKAFAQALKDEGLDVAGDPEISFTETHQVILNVGYGKGARIARDLEDNNIIVNYQATPDEEGFTASGALRMGVSEMTRFGMKEKEFRILAGFMADVIKNNSAVKKDIIQFRKGFNDMQFCFSPQAMGDAAQNLIGAIE